MNIASKYWTDEPARFSSFHLDPLLMYCESLSASDITVQAGEPVFAECYGKLVAITKKKLSHAEAIELLHSIYGQNGFAHILSGKEINMHYECAVNRRKKYRFRVNATGCLVEGHDSLQISFRLIPNLPPDIETLDLPETLLKALTPEQGIVYITGATGSGKTTLLASIIQSIAQQTQGHRKILTYEAPIEFVFDEIQKPNSVISQMEIPRHLPSFEIGIQNAMRRKPRLISISEVTTRETIRALVEAALTGHPIYTTLHSNGVAETIRRLVTAMPSGGGVDYTIDILETVRVIVWQKLIPAVDGKRVAVREFLIFDEWMRNKLLETVPEKLTLTVRDLLKRYGQTMSTDVEKKFNAGVINQVEFDRFFKTQK